MKIVHVVEALSVKGGGGDLAAADLAENQAKSGHDVSIIYFRGLRKGDVELKARGVRMVGIAPSKLAIARSFGFRIGLKRIFEWEMGSAEIVHIHGLWRWLQVAAASFCRRKGIPYVSQPHGSLYRESFLYKSVRKRIWWNFFDRNLVMKASKVQAESESDLVELVAVGIPKNNIYIAPCSIDFRAIARVGNLVPDWGASLAQNDFILFLARLDVNKGLDLMIKALAEIANDVPIPTVVICGPDYNETAGKMKVLAKKCGIDKKLLWVGIIFDEKWWAYKNATLYILPSKSENFGITVLEAMANHCPVLTTTATAWEEAGELGCAIVVPPTVDGVKKGLMDFFIMRKEERVLMTEKAYDYAVSRFDHEIVTQKVLKEYSDIFCIRKSQLG